jgi:hypothetical protein
MSIQRDIMYNFMEQELKRNYASSDGWSFTPIKHGKDYDTVYNVERVNKGVYERVKVFVTFNKQISESIVEEIRKPDISTNGLPQRYDFAIIVPTNADVVGIPKDVKIFTMKSFAYDNESLIWVKKRVQKPQETKGTQTVVVKQ